MNDQNSRFVEMRGLVMCSQMDDEDRSRRGAGGQGDGHDAQDVIDEDDDAVREDDEDEVDDSSMTPIKRSNDADPSFV